MRHFVQQYARMWAITLVLAAGLGLASTPAMAQVDVKPGVRVGFNYATFGGDTDQYAQAFAGSPGVSDVSTGRRSGYTVGGFLLFDFAGPFALQPELRYIQRGYTVDVTVSGFGQEFSANGTLKLDYIDVPVLARFDFPSAGVTPHVLGGPTVGFNISAEQETEAAGQTGTEDVSDSVSGTDFGLEVGAGLDFSLGAGTATIDARYGLGLSDLPDTEDTDMSLKNRALMVTAGFTF